MAEALQLSMSCEGASADGNGSGLLRSMTYTSAMCKRQPKPEAAVQRAILDLLAAEHVFAIRVNTGHFAMRRACLSARLALLTARNQRENAVRLVEKDNLHNWNGNRGCQFAQKADAVSSNEPIRIVEKC